MHEQYILQPTESSPGTGNSSNQRLRMAERSGSTRAAGSMQSTKLQLEVRSYTSPWVYNTAVKTHIMSDMFVI